MDILAVTHFPEINIQTFLKLKSAFLSLYTLRKLTFCGILSYQSPCGSREPILCCNKPRWDFHLKKVMACLYTLLLENEEQPSEKNLRSNISFRENKAHIPNFSYFWTLSKSGPSNGLQYTVSIEMVHMAKSRPRI